MLEEDEEEVEVELTVDGSVDWAISWVFFEHIDDESFKSNLMPGIWNSELARTKNKKKYILAIFLL